MPRPLPKWNRNAQGKSESDEHRDVLPGAPGGLKGRGAALNPGNRFESVRLHVLGDYMDEIAAEDPQNPLGPKIKTQLIRDNSKTIINQVQSPDMGFSWTLNPFRGCEHGCVYCYARPYHEYLGFSSGVDFETKIMVKPDAPHMLERELAAPKWKAEMIVMSGITDCWQPIEEKLRLSRACLEVLAKARQPISILTRSLRVTRDIDLLAELARYNAVAAAVTITTLDHKLAAKMEPRASSPADRFKAVSRLSQAGIPVTVMIAPTIPGLTDREIPQILEAAADSGARSAGLCMLRLPYQNKDLFLDFLKREFPDRADHVESLIRQVFDGKLYDANFPARGDGKGQVAAQIRTLFEVFLRKHHLDNGFPALSSAAFRRPTLDGQMGLFQ